MLCKDIIDALRCMQCDFMHYTMRHEYEEHKYNAHVAGHELGCMLVIATHSFSDSRLATYAHARSFIHKIV